MKFKMYCPFCSQKLEAEEEWQGQEAECPSCSKIFMIMKPETTVIPPVINVQVNNENQLAKGWNNQIHARGNFSYSAGMNNNARYIPNHMAKAVVAILFFFLPFGLVSFYWATQVNNSILREDYYEAERASRNALLWFWLSLAALPFIIIIIAAVCAAI